MLVHFTEYSGEQTTMWLLEASASSSGLWGRGECATRPKRGASILSVPIYGGAPSVRSPREFTFHLTPDKHETGRGVAQVPPPDAVGSTMLARLVNRSLGGRRAGAVLREVQGHSRRGVHAGGLRSACATRQPVVHAWLSPQPATSLSRRCMSISPRKRLARAQAREARKRGEGGYVVGGFPLSVRALEGRRVV